jgi:hypothetical protein
VMLDYLLLGHGCFPPINGGNNRQKMETKHRRRPLPVVDALIFDCPTSDRPVIGLSHSPSWVAVRA